MCFFSSLSGWGKLSKSPIIEDKEILAVKFVSLDIGMTCYNFISRVSISELGITCFMITPLDLLYKPFQIKWESLVEMRISLWWYKKMIVLKFNQSDVNLKLRLPRKHLDAIKSILRCRGMTDFL
jgi:hypothetical protein